MGWSFWYQARERALGDQYVPVDAPPTGRWDGPWTFWYPNGNKRREESYQSRRKHGLARKWYESGRLEEENHWVNGNRHGRFRSYGPDGGLREESHYVKDRREGPFARWRDDGSLIEQGTLGPRKHGLWSGEHRGGGRAFATHWANGKLDGPSTRWYPNGGLAEDGVRASDEWTGRVRWFYADGSPRQVEERRDGQLHGVIERWGPGGTRLSRAHLEHGKQHGSYERWHNTGALAERSSYVRGQRSGSWQLFYPDGTPHERGSYVAGKPDGPWITWHPNGVVESEGEWAAGKKIGEWRSFHPNGAQRSREQWRDGKPHGLLEAWYLDGVPMLKRHYEHGREVRWAVLNPGYDPLRPNARKLTPFGRVAIRFDRARSGVRRLWFTTLDCPEGTEPIEVRDEAGWTERGCADAAGRREGPWKGWYRKGVLRFEQSYRAGQLHGLARHYHEEKGRLHRVVTYVDGVPHGAIQEWSWHGGHVTTEGQFDHGTPVGHWWLRSPAHGRPILDLELDAGGRPIRWTRWSADSCKRIEVGEPAGDGLHLVRRYRDSIEGTLHREDLVVAVAERRGTSSSTGVGIKHPWIRYDRRHSTSWDTSGLTERGGYAEGKRDGIWEIWLGDGSVQWMAEYRAGEVVAKFRD
jgi:antitoxin component YwqK of YwqJK toxin-antitoxin module